MPIRPDMVGLTVRDLPASLRFYRLLGLDIPEVPEGEQFTEVITPNGYRISWNAEAMVKSIYPDWEEPRGQRVGLAFLCDSAAEVDAVYARLVAAGYQGVREPWDAFWGQRYAVVADPDGLSVDLFAPLPG